MKKLLLAILFVPALAIADDDELLDLMFEDSPRREALEAQANADNETARYLQQRRIDDINDSVRERNREVWFPNERRDRYETRNETINLGSSRR